MGSVKIGDDVYKEIRKVSQETGETIRSIAESILRGERPSPMNETSLKTSQKNPDQTIPEEKPKEKPEEKQPGPEGRLNIDEKKSQNKGEQETKPPKKEENMPIDEAKLNELVGDVGAMKKEISTTVADLVERIKTMPPKNPTETIKETSLTPEDVKGMWEKMEADRRKAEAESEEKIAKEEESKRLRQTVEEIKKMAEEQKKITEEHRKEFDRFCSMNPDDPKCKPFLEVVTRQVTEAIKPKEKHEEKPKEEKKAEVDEKIKDVIKALPQMNEEARSKLSKEEIDKRTEQVAELMDKLNLTPVDAFNVLWGDPRDKKGIIDHVSEDPEAIEKILKATEAKKLVSACNLGDEKACKLVEGELEEQGYALVKIDKEGKKRYEFVNPELDKRTHF